MVEAKQDLQVIGISFRGFRNRTEMRFKRLYYTTKLKFMCSHWPLGSSLRSLLVLDVLVPL